jgi:DNA-binding transcriptional MerR regulator
LRIGEVAQSAGVSIDTIRFYERRGVLPQPQRRQSGYRVYTEATVERIRLARALQNMGFTLVEIIDSLHRKDLGTATCGSERWRLEAVLHRINARIEELGVIQSQVTTVLAECDNGRCRFGPAIASST